MGRFLDGDGVGCAHICDSVSYASSRQMRTLVASARWSMSLAETVASSCASAASYGGPEDVFVEPIVVLELEFSDVQRQILGADFVERANNPALENAPEAFNRVCVNRADDVLASGVLNDLVGVLGLQVPV